MDDAECADLALLLRRTLQRLRAVHGDPPYNLVVDSGGRSDCNALHLHWRLRVAPDLVTWGGFELGTGMPINPSCPEKDAELLRVAIGGEGLVR
jgi:UDPglucose--hexose-1-phosphate uridylyltransferase